MLSYSSSSNMNRTGVCTHRATINPSSLSAKNIGGLGARMERISHLVARHVRVLNYEVKGVS